MAKILLLCYGNPGRLDDGLGPALGVLLEEGAPPGVQVEINYQLTVEDAGAVADSQAVVFVDAAVQGPEPFSFARVGERDGANFSSHSVEPGQLLYLGRTLFGAATAGFALAIRGYQFGAFGEVLSEGARRNLEAARVFIQPLLNGGLEAAAPKHGVLS